MTSIKGFRIAGSTAFAALSLVGMLAVSGCEERPYPQAAKTYGPPPPTELAGAPATAYAPPPPTVYTAPPASAPTYGSAPVASYSNDGLIAMAPIPNPGEGEGDYGYGRRHHRVHATYAAAPTGDYAPAPVYHKPVYHKPAPVPAPAPKPIYAKAPTPPAYKPAPKPVTPPAYKPVAPVYAAKVPTPAPAKPNTYTQKGAAVGAAAGAATGIVAHNAAAAAKNTASAAKTAYVAKATPPVGATPAKKVETKTAAVAAGAVAGAVVAAKDTAAVAKTAAASAKVAYNANKPTAPAPTPAPASGADRSTRLASLQSAMTDAISKGAVLTAPARFTANQPADVTLTIPAAFAETLRNEAGKDGLSDAAASVNMTAVLSGDGFAVTPDETQSQPLTLGQITEFHWTVTAQPNAKGPLHADVGADLLGGGSDTLALGSVQKAAGLGIKLTPRVVGAALLVLIAALVVAWLARGRGGPSRSASARRASRTARNRPLDMEETPAAH